MGEPKLPWYVERKSPNGKRNYYKREFIETLLEDLKSGRTTPKKAITDFPGITYQLLHNWRHGGGGKVGAPLGNKHAVKKPRTAAPKANGELLDYAENYEKAATEPTETWPIDASHVALALAYCRGEKSRAAVNYALRKVGIGKGKRRVMTATWLGAVLRWAVTHGYELAKVKRGCSCGRDELDAANTQARAALAAAAGEAES